MKPESNKLLILWVIHGDRFLYMTMYRIWRNNRCIKKIDYVCLLLALYVYVC